MLLNKLRFLQNLITLSAITLIIIVWSTVSFLAYQNKSLKDKPSPQTQINNSPTTKSTENWNVYINTNYSYEVKYPSDWMIEKKFAPDVISFLPPDNLNNNNSYNFDGVISIITNGWGPQVSTTIDAQKSFQAFMSSCSSQTPTQCTQKNSDDYSFEKQITIAHQPAFQTYGGCCMDIGRHVFLLSGSNYSFRFTLYNLSDEKNKLINESVFDQILSTFQFLPDTSNWKTFTNEEFKFSVNYPNDWYFKTDSINPESPIFYISKNIIINSRDCGISTSCLIISPYSEIIPGYPFITQEKISKYSNATFTGTRYDYYSMQNEYYSSIIFIDNSTVPNNWPVGTVRIYPHIISEKKILTNAPDTPENIYRMSQLENALINKEDFSIINQVLSTFKFIDENNAEQTNLWQPV